MFIISGATGQLGRKIVQNLLRLVPAEQIGVSVRDPAKATDLDGAGIRVRRGDYEDAASLRRAWDGAKRLLLVSSNAAASGGDPLAQHARAIAVAKELGVERIFYTSQIASSASSHFPPAHTHAATEEMLAQSGLPWTALRHGFYADSALAMNARGFATGVLAAPVDGKVSWTTHDDLAAADARLLAGTELFDGPTPPLTGAEALDVADLAQIAQTILGKPLERQELDDDEMLKSAEASGASAERTAIMMGYYRAARAGEFAPVDPTLARLIGRRPQSMRDFMAERLG
ncbi:NAD(P)H-binding protein [Devosia aurantiaca]|uniref:NAD(P)H-binding protein n=1 Tax=Devosia aurantiaca TaxID=2714858 RepID=A0A6M1SGA3_9HYPH|nr:NAD(P)H-binding protein [Devosia aurantiaca]NGP18517.1 NAD(P)H-binding protein [Devosia aurantiaca]